MITLQKISLPLVKSLVEISYKGDIELMQKYHIRPNMQFDECVEETMAMIEEMAKEKKVICMKVIYQKQPIGYVVLFDNFLYSFGLNIRFRKKEILKAWFSEIRQELKNDFITMLFMQNTRAVGWLLKCGLKILDTNKDNHSVTLVYDHKLVLENIKKNRECQ